MRLDDEPVLRRASSYRVAQTFTLMCSDQIKRVQPGSHVVADSGWEGFVAEALQQSEHVVAYAKNDHLNFHLHYLWNGTKRRFVPDFLVRLANGKTLALEVKGQDTPQDRKKRQALAEWMKAVNRRGGFGVWCDDAAFAMAQVRDILDKHAATEARRAASAQHLTGN